jgi:osmoprotectant transport system substrate-binding protein
VRRAVQVVSAVAFLLGACVQTGSRPSGSGSVEPRTKDIIVGSFNFAESELLADVYAEALRAAGFPVQRLTNVGSREVMEPAIEQGEIDIVPEYMGTALTFLDPARPPVASPTRAHEVLADEFAGRGIRVLEAAPGQNRNEIVVTAETARELDLSRISDLKGVAPALVFGGPPECPARPLCLQGLETVYGLRFGTFRSLDTGGPSTLAALRGGEIDVALLFTTDPALASEEFVILRDDLQLQPSENLVPIVREAVLQSYGEGVARILNEVTAKLDETSLRSLNERNALGSLSTVTIARGWLEERGFQWH